VWSIEPKWFKAAVDAIRAGTWKPKAFDDGEDDDDDESATPGYTVKNGVAIICIDGQMTKRGSSWGGCSTVAGPPGPPQRRGRLAGAGDPAAHLLARRHRRRHADLAADVLGRRRHQRRREKAVYAYIADMAARPPTGSRASARIYANTTAIVGSIGTYTVLEDDTGYQEQSASSTASSAPAPTRGWAPTARSATSSSPTSSAK
jgi:hypothetical protein